MGWGFRRTAGGKNHVKRQSVFKRKDGSNLKPGTSKLFEQGVASVIWFKDVNMSIGADKFKAAAQPAKPLVPS